MRITPVRVILVLLGHRLLFSCALKEELYEEREDDGLSFWVSSIDTLWKPRILHIYMSCTERSFRVRKFFDEFLTSLGPQILTGPVLILSTKCGVVATPPSAAAGRPQLPSKSSRKASRRRVPRNERRPAMIPEMILILISSWHALDQFLDHESSVSRFWRNDGDCCSYLVLMISDEPTSEDERTYERILRRLWKEHDIFKVVLAKPWYDRAFAYNPFAGLDGGGRLQRLKIDASLFARTDWFVDMNGHTLNVGMFERIPTAIQLPKTEDRRDGGFAGLDGLLLATISHAMNFSVNIVPPSNGIEYGFRTKDGSYVGTLGDVIYDRVDISFNGMFIKSYVPESVMNPIRFGTPVSFDCICVVVPKAPKVPKWLRLFQCFDKTTWTWIAVAQLLHAAAWYFLQRYARDIASHRHPPKPPNFFRLLLQTLVIFLALPVRMPKLLVERVCIGSFLLFALTLVGTFQGNLYRSFATDSSFRDVNSLKELAESSFPIFTSSPNLGGLFGTGEEDNDVMRTLRKRLEVHPWSSKSSIDRAAFDRNIAAVDRLNDLRIRIDNRYVDKDGNSLLHIVNDCPRSYYLSYIAKPHSLYLERIDVLVCRAREAGLLMHWYRSAEETPFGSGRGTRRAREQNSLSRFRAFTLNDLQAAFLMLIIGHLVSLLVFLLEYSVSPSAASSCVRRPRLRKPIATT